jgi:polyferredoxin
MRLKPRTIKRKMFTCTECAQCISACDQVQQGKPGGGLLHWVEGERALPVTGERKPPAPVRGGAARPG